MPMYEYRCESCGNRFEVLQRMGEGSDGLACPECGAGEPVKQFSTFASNGDGQATAAACAAPPGAGFT